VVFELAFILALLPVSSANYHCSVLIYNHRRPCGNSRED
jgi:hypothetical protein